jgi:uncharacterized protein (TIGR02147 family)
MPAPHLYDTTDYRSFLRSALEGRRLTGVDLSRSLGRSEAWLSMVLKGRRALDPEMVEPVATALRLDGEETAYFAALVDLHSRSERSRRLAWATVQATQRHLAQGSVDSAVALLLLSKWHVGAIAELSLCEGFQPDPRWIARTLVPPIEAVEAEEALTALLRLGILVPDDRGGLRCDQDLTWSPSELPVGAVSEAVAEHQRAMLGIAADALQRARYNERHASSTTFAIPEELYAKLVARLREIERELLVLGNDRPSAPNRVYQLGIQLFPISLYTDAEGDQSIDIINHGAPPDIDPDTTE